MRFLRFQNAVLALSLLAFAGYCVVLPAPATAQSNTSGDIAGTVSDASGAVVPNAKVTVTSSATGEAKAEVSDKSGTFRVPLLAPGRYKISIGAAGFETSTSEVTVSAGVVTPVSIKLSVGSAATTVEVTGGALQVLHTEDAQISTSFSAEEIAALPNPGGDLTFVAQTTPGAVMNTQGGYGNFSVDGLPGTSNTFTVNGGYEGDPYLNLNNSGATNLLLGNNDVDTVTVTTNSFDSAFGGLGGAQVNETSKAGTNKWHGNLVYWWNGRLLNANDYFNKQSGSPRGFDNANQYAASIGGPLKKDKIFGFINTEGLHVIIPERSLVGAPSPAWQAAILGPAGSVSSTSVGRSRPVGLRSTSTHARPEDPNNPMTPYGNLADNGNQSEAALYQAIFAYYNNAKGASSAIPDPLGDPDVVVFNGQTANLATEWLVTDRIDFNLSDTDHLYIHSKVDHGIQPTATSFLSPDFNALSPQPSYEGQLSETHTFNSALTNQFLFAASYYRAIFTNTNAAKLAKTIPFVLIPEAYATSGSWDVYGGAGNWIGNIDYALPQGRNVTGYQFADDLNYLRGKHNFKFGFAMRRDDITDYTSSEHNINFAGGENIILDPGSFAAGYSDEWAERFPRRLSEPVALYVMGMYAQDTWKPVPNLAITGGLRLEHDSNPLCRTNCISNFSTDFANLNADRATPYNQIFSTGLSKAFTSEERIAYEPRVGFSLQPGGSASKTTIRGGFGMFADYFPAQIMGDLISNLPTVDRFTVLGLAYGNPITLDTTRSDSGHAQAVVSNTALTSLFPQGGYYRNDAGTCPDPLSIYCATGGVFTRPTVTAVAHKISLPTYMEWSMAVEHEILPKTVLSVMYVGNRSYHQPVGNTPNAYDPYGTNATLPLARPNGTLGSVTQYYSAGVSNFNGVIATLTSHIKILSLQFNYAYGHALDEISNGGFDAFGVNAICQINPNNLRQQYGNADYDVRHYVSANYAIKIPYFGGPHVLTDDWEVAGTVFHNSGYPFSVTDASGAVTYGATPLAMQIDNNFNHHCGGEKHTMTNCDFASHFTSSTDFGQQSRNQLYGPNYTDFDMDLMKGFKLPFGETTKLKVGAQFFNAFNHPNFQIPNADVNDGPGCTAVPFDGSQCSNGIIYTQANTPTSILGAFLGGDAAPRLIQAKLSLVF